jgi:protein-disulfide isomerase
VADAAACEACRADPVVRAGAVADGELGKRIGATGTPTIVINGMRYERPLQATELK